MSLATIWHLRVTNFFPCDENFRGLLSQNFPVPCHSAAFLENFVVFPCLIDLSVLAMPHLKLGKTFTLHLLAFAGLRVFAQRHHFLSGLAPFQLCPEEPVSRAYFGFLSVAPMRLTRTAAMEAVVQLMKALWVALGL